MAAEGPHRGDRAGAGWWRAGVLLALEQGGAQGAAGGCAVGCGRHRCAGKGCSSDGGCCFCCCTDNGWRAGWRVAGRWRCCWRCLPQLYKWLLGHSRFAAVWVAILLMP